MNDTPSPARPIEALVFDVGHVLVEPDFTALVALLVAHEARFSSIDDLLRRAGLEQHEAGALDGPSYLGRLASLAARPPDPGLLAREWNALYRAVPAMIDLLRRLKATHRVYLLSNMGSLHWAQLEADFGIPSLAHDALASYAVRLSKPDPGIYAVAEQRFGLTPATTVFVDDRADNVAAARARGWHAVLHLDAARTSGELARLGLPVHDGCTPGPAPR